MSDKSSSVFGLKFARGSGNGHPCSDSNTHEFAGALKATLLTEGFCHVTLVRVVSVLNN